MYKISDNLISQKMDEKRREEMWQAIREYRSPDSIIAYLFASLDREQIPTAEKKLHSAISELKKGYKTDLFENFTFSRGDIYPFSKELERVLFRFQQSSILGTINPTMEYYKFSSESKEIVKRHYSDKFSGEEKKLLSEMGNRLKELLYD